MRDRGPIGKKERKEVGLAFVASVLLHLLLLLLLLILTLASPSKPLATPQPEEVPMEVTIIPPPPPPVEPPPPTFVDTSTAEEAPAPPEDTPFESDRDTVAASEIPGTGPSDLPSVEGRDESYMELANQQMQLGPQTPSQPAPPEQPQEESQMPQEVAEQQPEETLPEEEPEPTPDEIVLTRPPEVRRAEPVVPDHVQQEVRRAQVPDSARAAAAGFQPERRATRIEGGVNNRGRASVAAMSTPLGRYKKALSDAIGSRWYFYVSNDLGLFSIGTATIQFVVTASGRVTSVRVVSNSSNESFASVSIRSIMDAEIPPIPPEVAEHLENNRIEVDFTFSILAN